MGRSSITLEFETALANIRGEIQTILHDNIQTFKETISEEVHKSVYPVYSPKDYDRREDSGGLSDINNYDVTEGDLSLTLSNNTVSSPNYWKYTYSVPITEIVENGSGDGWVGVPARPFMEKGLDKFAYDILQPQIEKRLGGGK